MTVLLNAGTDVVRLAAFSIWWQEGTRPTEIDYFSQEFLIGMRQLVASKTAKQVVLRPVLILFNSLSFGKANKNQRVNKEDKKNSGIIP